MRVSRPASRSTSLVDHTPRAASSDPVPCHPASCAGLEGCSDESRPPLLIERHEVAGCSACHSRKNICVAASKWIATCVDTAHVNAMRHIALVVITTAALLPGTRLLASDVERTKVCHNQYLNQALIGEPLVSDANTAKSIFLIIEKKLHRPDLVDFPDVVAADEGDHWSVGRSSPNTNIRGGGQLRLSVSKCNGAVSDIVWER